MITVVKKVHWGVGSRGAKLMLDAAQASKNVPEGRVPRISHLMALAIRFDGLIGSGTVTDQSELARLARVTQPRMTQIMNLLALAPDVQEELLFLPRTTARRDPIHEHMLRPLTRLLEWPRQRRAWRQLRAMALPGVLPQPEVQPTNTPRKVHARTVVVKLQPLVQ